MTSNNSRRSVRVKSPLASISNICHDINQSEPSPVHNKGTRHPAYAAVMDERKENEAPFIGETNSDEDEEVFFGSVTNKEQSKVAKLRRKTQVFVANFRDTSWSGTDSLNDESYLTLSSSESQWSRDSNSASSSSSMVSYSSPSRVVMHPHLRPSQFLSIASSSDSPSICAHRAASKIQTWYRLARQAQEYRGVVSQAQQLGGKTDDFILEIRREKERIRLCSTPEQGISRRGEKLDTGPSSPFVIVPSHRPCLVETSPQQNTEAIPWQEALQPAHEYTRATEIVFNANDDKTGTETMMSRSQGSTLLDSALSCPEELSSKLRPTDSEAPQAHSISSRCTPVIRQHVSMQESCVTPKIHVKQSYLNQINALTCSSSSTYASPSFVQSGSACQTTSLYSATSPYHGTYFKDASAFTGYTINEQTRAPHFTPTKFTCSDGGTVNSPFTPLCLQVGKSSTSYTGSSSTHLKRLQLNMMSSFPKVDCDQIQSATTFSSPRLFPITVQAVQLHQSIPSAVLFSPLKISDHKPTEDNHHSQKLTSLRFGAQETESPTPQKPVEKENYQSCHPLEEKPVSSNDSSKHESVIPALNVTSLRKDAEHSSTPLGNFAPSPNVSIRKSVKKYAIVTPHSADNMDSESGCQTTPRANSRRDELQLAPSQRLQLATSFQCFPSTVVAVRETQDVMTSSSAVLARKPEADRDMTSPHLGPEGSESARRKQQLLDQKKAELTRIRAQKTELKQTLKTANEMCLAMKQEIQSALRSNTSQTNIPVHLLSLGCQGISSLTLTDPELDIVTRLHTIRNSHQEGIPGLTASPACMIAPTRNKGSVHLRWHTNLVTQVHRLSSPGHSVRVARPILAKRVGKARRLPMLCSASPSQRVQARQDTVHKASGHAQTPREKLVF